MSVVYTYVDAVKALSNPDRLLVEKALAELDHSAGSGGRWSRMVASIRSESRLELALWREFFDLAKRAPTVLDFRADLISWSKTYRDPVGLPASPNHPFTRVTSREAFVKGLVNQAARAGKSMSFARANALVKQLRDAKRWHGAVAQLEAENLDLACFTMWATFNEVGSAAFAGLVELDSAGVPTTRAREVVSQVGLDDYSAGGVGTRGRAFVVFEYRIDSPASGIDAQIPTFVEALKGDPPNYYFHPAPSHEKRWGWTVVWPTATPHAKSRPEVVHRPSSPSGLTRKFEELN